MKRKATLLSAKLSGYAAAFPDNYGLKVEELVILLDASKLVKRIDKQG